MKSFELLMAELLCHELSSKGRTQLTSLVKKYPALHSRYKEYVAMHKLLHRFQPQTLKHAFLPSLPAPDGRLTKPSGSAAKKLQAKPKSTIKTLRKTLPTWLALAATLTMALGLWMFFAPAAPSAKLQLSYSYGGCLENEQKIPIGKLEINKIRSIEIRSIENSLCDFLVKKSDTGRYAIRLFPNSHLSFRRKQNKLHLFLKKGSLLLKADKQSGSGLAIHTGGYRVRVLGTRFFAEKLSEHKLRVEVLDGAALVESSPYLHSPELSLLTSDSKDTKTSFAKTLPALFRSKENVVEGRHGILLAWEVQEFSKTRHWLGQLERELKKIEKQKKRPANKKEIQTLLRRHQKGAKDLRLTGLLKEEKSYKLPLRKIRILKQAATKLSLEPPPRYSKTKGRTNKDASKLSDQEKGIASQILSAYQKKEIPSLFYRFHLKNGSVLSGMAQQKGNLYIVKSTKGIQKIKKKEVKKVEVFFE